MTSADGGVAAYDIDVYDVRQPSIHPYLRYQYQGNRCQEHLPSMPKCALH